MKRIHYFGIMVVNVLAFMVITFNPTMLVSSRVILGVINVAAFCLNLFIVMECRFCPVCDVKINRDEAKFCPKCGAVLPVASKSS